MAGLSVLRGRHHDAWAERFPTTFSGSLRGAIAEPVDGPAPCHRRDPGFRCAPLLPVLGGAAPIRTKGSCTTSSASSLDPRIRRAIAIARPAKASYAARSAPRSPRDPRDQLLDSESGGSGEDDPESMQHDEASRTTQRRASAG